MKTTPEKSDKIAPLSDHTIAIVQELRGLINRRNDIIIVKGVSLLREVQPGRTPPRYATSLPNITVAFLVAKRLEL
jgi:hypothetical protein